MCENIAIEHDFDFEIACEIDAAGEQASNLNECQCERAIYALGTARVAQSRCFIFTYMEINAQGKSAQKRAAATHVKPFTTCAMCRVHMGF